MPQPIDFQTEMAKATLADRIQSIMTRTSLAAQQRQAAELNQVRMQAESQVQDMEQPENPEVDGEGRRKNPFSGRRQKRDNPDSEDDGRHPPPGEGEGQQIDFSV